MARSRLLLAALRLFAAQGYAKTSIRQITLAAQANIASVSYYFGNKAGLYRAVFFGEHAAAGAVHTPPEFTLHAMFAHMLAPLRNGIQALWWIQLYRREMLEPTGLWQEKVDRGMQPLHNALVALLCDRLGLARADDEVEALAMVVVAPAVHLIVNREVVDQLAPQLLAGDDAVDVWCRRLERSATALIAAERRRRAAVKAKPAPRPSAARQPDRHSRSKE